MQSDGTKMKKGFHGQRITVVRGTVLTRSSISQFFFLFGHRLNHEDQVPLKLQSQTKESGTRRKFSPPPTFNVDNEVIFPFLLEKNAKLEEDRNI